MESMHSFAAAFGKALVRLLVQSVSTKLMPKSLNHSVCWRRTRSSSEL